MRANIVRAVSLVSASLACLGCMTSTARIVPTWKVGQAFNDVPEPDDDYIDGTIYEYGKSYAAVYRYGTFDETRLAEQLDTFSVWRSEGRVFTQGDYNWATYRDETTQNVCLWAGGRQKSWVGATFYGSDWQEQLNSFLWAIKLPRINFSTAQTVLAARRPTVYESKHWGKIVLPDDMRPLLASLGAFPQGREDSYSVNGCAVRLEESSLENLKEVLRRKGFDVASEPLYEPGELHSTYTSEDSVCTIIFDDVANLCVTTSCQSGGSLDIQSHLRLVSYFELAIGRSKG